eukprot:ANDGO_02226.mRNA.1 Cilia- and flagella-associated protein 46
MFKAIRISFAHLLDEARSLQSLEKLHEAHDFALKQSVFRYGCRSSIPHSVSPDALVEIAECAYELKDATCGFAAIHAFLESRPAESMYLVRAHFAKGLLESLACSSLKGAELVERTLLSLNSIRKGVELAIKKKDRFAFLVYNGAVHIWNVSRLLSFAGVRGKLCQVLQDTVKNLEEVADSRIDLRLRLLMSLALGFVEINKVDDAIKTMANALDLCNKQLPAMKKHVVGAAIEVNRGNAANVAKLKVSECSTAALKVFYAAQCLRSGVLKDQKSLDSELAECMALFNKTLAENTPAGKSVDLTKIPIDFWDSMGEFVRSLVVPGSVVAATAQQIVESAAKRCPSLAARTSVEAVQAILPVVDLDDFLSESNVNERSSALKKLEKALSSAERSSDRLLMEYICVWIWNIGMHLLQPNTRAVIYRPFVAAANVLHNIESELHLLRVKFHYEISRCEIATDTLIKAAGQVKIALALDYVVDETAKETYSLARPMDRYLLPLDLILELRTNIYKSPSSMEDQIALLVDQAREAKFPNVRRSLLERAVAILKDGLELERYQIGQGQLLRTPEETTSIKLRRGYLYADMVRIGWQGDAFRFPSIIEAIYPLLCETKSSWDAVKHKELMLDIVRACFIMADARILSARGDDLGELTVNDFDFGTASQQSATQGADDAGLEPMDPAEVELASKIRHRVAVMQAEVETFVSDGFDLAVKMKDETCIVNGAVFVWNHYVPLVSSSRCGHLVSMFQKAFSSVDQVFAQSIPAPSLDAKKDPKKDKDAKAATPTVLSKCPVSEETVATWLRIVSAYVRCLICQHCADRPISTCYEQPADSTSLKTALESCLKGKQRFLECSRPSLQPLREVIGLEARVRRLSGQKPLETASAEESLFSFAELLSQPWSKPEEPEVIAKKACEVALKAPSIPLEACCIIAAKSLYWKFFRVAYDLALRVVSAIPESASSKKWRWFATARRVAGQSLIMLIDPNRLDKQAQDSLRCNALEQIAFAVEYFAKSDLVNSAVMLDVLGVFLSSVSPLLNSSVTKQLSIPSLERICAVAFAFFTSNSTLGPRVVKDAAKGQILLDCFMALVDALREKRYFSTDKERIDAECLEWCNKAIEIVPRKLHKQVIEAAIRCSTEATVKRWMARVKEYDAETQGRAWIAFAGIVKDVSEQKNAFLQAAAAVPDPIAKVEFIVEYATWCFFQNYPIADTIDLLLYCADTLLDKDSSDAGDGAQSPHGDSRSVISKRSRMSGASKISKLSGSSSRASSKLSKSSMRSSKRSVLLKELAASIEEELGLSCKNLELLSRTYVLLALLAKDYRDRVRFSQLAVRCYAKLFETTSRFLNQFAEDAASLDASGKPSVLEKIVFPASQAEWMMYDFPPSVIDRMKGSVSAFALNRVSIEKPELSLAFVDSLISVLDNTGLWHLEPSLLKFAEFVTDHVMCNADLGCVYKLRKHRLHVSLGFPQSSVVKDDYDKIVSATGLSSRQKKVFFQEVSQFVSLQTVDPMSVIQDAVLNKMRSASPFKQMVLRPLTIREMWLRQAQELLLLGEFSQSKDLATECLRHAKAFGDLDILPQTLYLLSILRKFEGDVDGSVEYLRFGQSLCFGDLSTWCVSVTQLAGSYWQRDDVNGCLCTLRDACRILETFVDRPLNGALDSNLVIAKLSLQLASYLSSILFSKLMTAPLPALAPEIDDIRFYLKAAKTRVGKFGDCIFSFEVDKAMIQFEYQLSMFVRALEKRSILVTLTSVYGTSYAEQMLGLLKTNSIGDLSEVTQSPFSSVVASLLLLIAQVYLDLYVIEQTHKSAIERMETPFFPPATTGQDDTPVREFLKDAMAEEGLKPAVDGHLWQVVLSLSESAAVLCESQTVQAAASLMRGLAVSWRLKFAESDLDDSNRHLLMGRASTDLFSSLKISLAENDMLTASRASLYLAFLDKSAKYFHLALGLRSAWECAGILESLADTDYRDVRLKNAFEFIRQCNGAISDRFHRMKSALPDMWENVRARYLNKSENDFDSLKALVAENTSICACIRPMFEEPFVPISILFRGQSFVDFPDAPADFSRALVAIRASTEAFDGVSVCRLSSQLLAEVFEQVPARIASFSEGLSLKDSCLCVLSQPSMHFVNFDVLDRVLDIPLSAVSRDFSLYLHLSRKESLPKITGVPRNAAFFVVDEFSESHPKDTLSDLFKKEVVGGFASSATKEWKGLYGGVDRIVSNAEFTTLLSNQRCLYRIGYEPLLASVRASHVIGVEMSGLEAVFNLQVESTEKSSERRKKHFTETPLRRRICESQISFAAISSLNGCCAVITTPVPISEKAACSFLRTMIQSSIEEPSRSMPEVLHRKWRKAPETATETGAVRNGVVYFGIPVPGYVDVPEGKAAGKKQ